MDDNQKQITNPSVPTGGAPQFTPPNTNNGMDIPPSTPVGGVPQFTPPNNGMDIPPSTPVGGVPQFTPPNNGMDIPPSTPVGGGAPIPQFSPPQFTPPAFTPPTGPTCHYHNNESAEGKCPSCGKLLCGDCLDNYSVKIGPYAGQPICYDCWKDIVSDNVKQLKKNKAKISFQFGLSAIGMIMGFIFGLGLVDWPSHFDEYVVLLLCMGIGGVFFTATKRFFVASGDAFRAGDRHTDDGIYAIIIALCYLMIKSMYIAVVCTFETIKNTISHICYLKRTSGFINSDREALIRMDQYMIYTQVRDFNPGVPIEALMQSNPSLAENTFAQTALARGEQAAEEDFRQCVTSINENGEIIRSFVA